MSGYTVRDQQAFAVAVAGAAFAGLASAPAQAALDQAVSDGLRDIRGRMVSAKDKFNAAGPGLALANASDRLAKAEADLADVQVQAELQRAEVRDLVFRGEDPNAAEVKLSKVRSQAEALAYRVDLLKEAKDKAEAEAKRVWVDTVRDELAKVTRELSLKLSAATAAVEADALPAAVKWKEVAALVQVVTASGFGQRYFSL